MAHELGDVTRVLVRWETKYVDQQLAAFTELVDLLWQSISAREALIAVQYWMDDEDFDGPLQQRGFDIDPPRRLRLGPIGLSSGTLHARRNVTDRATASDALALADLEELPSTVAVTFSSGHGTEHCVLTLEAGLDVVGLGTADDARWNALASELRPALSGVAARHGLTIHAWG